MRFTTVLSLFAASMAVLSPVYAAPVSTEAGSAVIKRCIDGGCKDAIVAPTTSGSDNSQGSLSVDDLVAALINTLTALKSGPTTANSTALDAVVEPSSSGPSDGTKTLAELVGVAL